MKRSLVVALLFIALLFSFSSCSKCYTCDFGNGETRELCSKDHPGGYEALNWTIDEYEKQGYKCTSK